MKPSTTLEYHRRLDKVIRYIGDHLDEELDLNRLASVSCFSLCHFHRIYAGITGETVAETVRRARLSRSAACLSVDGDIKPEGDVRVLDLAGGRHAVLLHKGPYAELNKAYAWLYGTWLPQSGEEAADRPVHEEYLNNPRDLPPAEWLTQICLPLATK